MNDLVVRYQSACEVSREAADRARHLFVTRELGQFELKGPQDYLTEADGEIERLIRRRIARCFPEDAFFGEEGEQRSTGTFTWVVDPIDGTANFARGIPLFGISVGMLHEGEPALGVICIPMLDETFAALRGRGATLNGEPTAVSGTMDMARAVVELGWSTRRPLTDYARLVDRVTSAGAGMRNGGSAAVALASVAAGRLDGFCELHINSWDCIAGIVLVREAGGWVSDFLTGNGLVDGNALLACTPPLREPLVEATGVGA